MVIEAEVGARKEMSFIQYLKYWIPVLFWMIFIFWMSTGTFSEKNSASTVESILRFLIPSILPGMIDVMQWALRKFGHVAEYFVLGYLLFRAFRGGSKESRIPRWAFSSFLVLVFYAASDELHQSFVSTRTASVYDVGIDILGGIIAMALSALLHLHRSEKIANK